MATLLDSSLWVDFTRARSPRGLKAFIAHYALSPSACTAEPILFELLRHATESETRQLIAQFEAVPVLGAPPTLWTEAAQLGRACRRSGFTAGSIDLLIAVIAVHHQAELITFDEDFKRIADVSALEMRLLKRPVS